MHGSLRCDDGNHWYLIPEDKLKEFDDHVLSFVYSIDYNHAKMLEIYGEYSVPDNDIQNLKIAMASPGIQPEDLLKLYIKAVNRIDDFFEYANESKSDREFIKTVLNKLTADIAKLR